MRHRPFSRSAVASLCLATAALLATPGCGGGGGGGGGGGCDLPGTLTALALEGNPAPDTAGGTYGFIAANTKISVAQGGWTAYQADFVTMSGTTAGIFVAPPSQPVRLVYRFGEAVPAPGSGTISGFTRLWVTEDGIVVVLVTISGGTHTLGLLTARVDGSGTVVEKASAVLDNQTLPAASGMPSPGVLQGIPPALVQVADDGTIFFVGNGASDSGVFYVSRTGTGLTAAAQEGQAAVGFGAGNFLGSGWQALGIDEDGLLLGYVVNITPGGEEALYANNLSVATLVATDGVSPPGVGARTLAETYDGGPLVVALSGGVGVLVWEGELSGAEPNDVVLLRQVAPTIQPLQVMAAGGQTAPGGGSGATLGELLVLDPENDAFAASLRAEVVSGTTAEIFYALPSAGSFLEIWREGEDAPGAGPGTFTTTYPSLLIPNQVEADVQGSVAVTAVLSDATTGLFWAIRDCGFFAVVKQGDLVPFGGTFATFAAASSVATAFDVVAFRGGVDGLPGTTSGIFRRN